jgi:hypothetical protein
MDNGDRTIELERRLARLTKAADAMRAELKFARKFIVSRWIRMHPEGIELYDDCCENYDAIRNNIEPAQPSEEVVVGYWYEGVWQDLSGGRYPAPPRA